MQADGQQQEEERVIRRGGQDHFGNVQRRRVHHHHKRERVHVLPERTLTEERRLKDAFALCHGHHRLEGGESEFHTEIGC